jgi:Ran GTPase-activating protein (RanGAP) involved in mRNA processing and transport
LDISNTQLGPRGGAELAEGLYDYKSLTVFKCGGNGFGPNAGNLLLKALAHQKGLKWLDIGDNGLNDKCCPALAQLIEVQPFESLVIRDNKFKDGMKHVIRAIEACTTFVFNCDSIKCSKTF